MKKKAYVNITLTILLIVGLSLFAFGYAGAAGSQNLFYGNYIYIDFNPTSATITQGQTVTFSYVITFPVPGGGGAGADLKGTWLVKQRFCIEPKYPCLIQPRYQG
jgi:hypothetical protein